MNESLAALLRSRYLGAPDRTFLREPGGTSLSYGEVDDMAARMGEALREAGALQGERVLVQVPKSPLALALYLACLRIGAVYVPLNPSYTATELEHFLTDSRPAVIVCDASRAEVFRSMAAGCGVVRASVLSLGGGSGDSDLVARAERFGGIGPVASHVDDPAVMLYTSGTTGRPKGAVLTQTNLVSNAMALHETWGFRSGDVLVHSLPIFHAHGLFVALHTAMLNASEVIFLPRFDADAVIDHLQEATVFMGVPTHYSRLLESPRLDADVCRRLRLFTSGSAPLSPAIFDAFEQRTGHRILERYGTTEAGMITSNPLHGERKAGSVGFPLPGVTVRVVDSRGSDVPAGEVGRVCVDGPNVFAGYWRGSGPQVPAGGGRRRASLGGKTPRREGFLRDGFFVTGDLGRVDAEGRLTLVGRSVDLVITAGLNVYPVEVERAIEQMDEVAECAVVGVPHPDLGESVVAVVVRAGPLMEDADRPDQIEPFERELTEHLEANLARFKRPRSYFFVDELPRNAMGKIEKNVLRDRYSGTFTSGATGEHGASTARSWR